MTAETKVSWAEFADAVAQAANVPAEAIDPHTRLLEDLGLDSLALAEVVAMLIVSFEMESLADDLAQREWAEVRVGVLYQEYREERPRSTGIEHAFILRSS